jgi:hypothetical protein
MTVRCRALAAFVVALLAAGASRDAGAGEAPQPRTPFPPRGSQGPRTLPQPGTIAPPELDAPYHGALDRFAFGGFGELRFAEDREAGVSDPEWFSVGGVNAFAFVHLSPRIDLAGRAGWDRGADDFTLERAEIQVRMGTAMQAHAGIFLTPLGRTNLIHDAPSYDFAERSLVATQIIGVPNAMLGAGIRKFAAPERGSRLSYEVDLVTGYDDGVIMDAPGGTRVPRGRNNYGDQNGLPALAVRGALHGAQDSEIGLAAQSGPYNQTTVGGVRVDDARWIHVIVADGMKTFSGFRVSGEAAYAAIDVPPDMEALFAQSQCGASVEAVRTLFEPLFRGWKGSALTAGMRADAVDFDRAVAGDSRSRISASLNLYHRPLAVTRFGWYYEVRRDRFNNSTPLAGVTLTAATYF